MPFSTRGRVNKAGQPIEPICPLSDRLRASRTRCLFEAVEGRGHSASLDDQQSIQGRHVVRCQLGRDLFVHLRMDLGTQMVCQSFKRAEGRQINGGLAQRLDCPIDQVRRITHRRGRLDHRRCHQLLAGIGIDRGFEIDPHRRTIVVERRLSGSLAENAEARQPAQVATPDAQRYRYELQAEPGSNQDPGALSAALPASIGRHRCGQLHG